MTALVIFLGSVAVCALAVIVWSLRADWLDDLRHRGEVADPVDGIERRVREIEQRVDRHAAEAMHVIAGSDLIDSQVPQGTGEALAREIETYFKEIQR